MDNSDDKAMTLLKDRARNITVHGRNIMWKSHRLTALEAL